MTDISAPDCNFTLKKGDLVRLKNGVKQKGAGTIIGFQYRYPEVARIHWHSNAATSVQTTHVSFLEKIDLPEPDQSFQPMSRCPTCKALILPTESGLCVGCLALEWRTLKRERYEFICRKCGIRHERGEKENVEF